MIFKYFFLLLFIFRNIFVLDATFKDFLNIAPEDVPPAYENEEEIPLANNDPEVLENVLVDQENFYPDHTRKNTVIRNDVFDYMEETGDFRYLDHEIEQMLESDARKYTDMLIRLSKYRQNELDEIRRQEELEKERQNDPAFIRAEAEQEQKEQKRRENDYENFLLVKANRGFE